MRGLRPTSTVLPIMSSASHATAHQRLAAIVSGLRYEDLPAEVIDRAKLLVLDSLGCLMGGLGGGPTVAVRGVVAEFGGKPAATIIGTTTRTSAPLAALANGTALRYLDFNDSYNSRRPGGHNTEIGRAHV